MPTILHNLPWLFLVAAVALDAYQRNAWAVPGDAALVVLGFGGQLGLICAVVLFAMRRTPLWYGAVIELWPRLALRPLFPTLTIAATMPATGATARLSEREWLNWANHRDDAPMVVITGPAGAGKTTITTAILGDRPGQVIVCTPKPAHLDPWGGIDAVRLSMTNGQISYRPMADAVTAVYREMTARYAGSAVDPEPLTLVIDEYSDIIAEEKDVRDMVLRMWALARAARIRLITISTEVNVKAWGLEGRGDARQNLVFLKVSVDSRMQRSAAMYRWNEPPIAIDIRNVKRLAVATDLRYRAWPLRASSAGRGTQPLSASAEPDTATVEQLRKLRRAGISRDEAHAMGLRFRDEKWTAAAMTSQGGK